MQRAKKETVFKSRWLKERFLQRTEKDNFEIINLGNTLMALDSKLIIHSDGLLSGCKYTKPYFNKRKESEIFAGTLPKRTSIDELSDIR